MPVHRVGHFCGGYVRRARRAVQHGGLAILLGIWHHAATLAAIRHSGGLFEALTLPVLMAIPAAAIGGISGLVGAGASAVWDRVSCDTLKEQVEPTEAVSSCGACRSVDCRSDRLTLGTRARSPSASITASA